MRRLKLSTWAMAAVGALSVSAASAGEPGACRPQAETNSYQALYQPANLEEIELVSHCDTACDECAPISCDSCDGCDGCGDSGCSLGGDGKFLFFDGLKRMEFLEDECGDPLLTLSAGGALRYRFYNEDNRLRPPGPGNDRQSNYSQWRFTPYLQADIGDRVTAYIQGIDAPTFGNEIRQLPIDENRFDLLQYYVDIKVLETDSGSLGFKWGRQLLQYGDQHVVSPLAWANTFRNFEGYKVYWKGENWDVDGLLDMRSVNGAAGNIFRPNSFDTPDQTRSLHGIYSTYKKLDKGKLDLYWLWSREDEFPVNPAANTTSGNRHTFGARWYHTNAIKDACGDVARTWKYDIQGAYQVGEDAVGGINGGATSDVEAGFFNMTASHTWNQAAWTPTITGLFYYGSGDQNTADGTNDAVYTLFPLGHAYWGLADQFSGQNLIDYMVATTVKPTKKLTLSAAFHVFEKAEQADAIYNIANVRLGSTAGTSQNIGSELDLIATYQWKENVTLQGGYFWFWYGDAVGEAVGGVPTADSDTFYFLANWTF